MTREEWMTQSLLREIARFKAGIGNYRRVQSEELHGGTRQYPNGELKGIRFRLKTEHIKARKFDRPPSQRELIAQQELKAALGK